MSNIVHRHYLMKAFDLAQQGRGYCAPNPAVGAVLVKNNQIIGAGFHQKYGEAHAETNAIGNLSVNDTKDSILYITLEPCGHHGKTPPCTDLIIQHQIRAVYYAADDPHPVVNGKGVAQLKQANIICEKIPLDNAVEFYQSYQYWLKEKKPYITFKLAVTLDGKSAAKGGEPYAITSEKTNRINHQFRKKTDAILTTARTIIADDPQMNARFGDKIESKIVYVIDRDLEMPLVAKIFNTAKKLIIFHAKNVSLQKIKKLQAKKVECRLIKLKGKSTLDLEQIWQEIAKDGIHDLWIEAGGRFFTSLAQQGFLQQAYIDVAPKMLGKNAYNTFHMNDDLLTAVKHKQWKIMGEDVMLHLVW